MAGVKPWQVVLMVVAMLAITGSIFYSCSAMGPPVKQATYATMVDVNTGDLFRDDYPKKMVSYPQKRPGTDISSLYPVHKLDGKWMLESRYLSLIKADKTLQPIAIVDWRTGETKATSDKPVSAQIFPR